VPTDDAAVLRRLLDVALAAAAERRTERVLRLVLNAARELVGAPYAAVGVPDGADGFATFLTSGVDSATWKAIGDLPRQHGLLGVLLQETGAVRLSDITADPRFVGWPGAHPQMQAFLGVPIVAGGDILAELYLAGESGGPEFTADDQRLVETLAAHAALAIVNAQRLERTRELAVAEERTRLARDLHDSVTQTLFGLTLATEAAATVASAEPKVLEQLDRVRALGVAAREEMRSLVETLRPVDLGRDGLVTALRHRIELAQRVHELPIGLEVTGSVELPAAVQRELLYVLNEAIANALQHAEAKAIAVTLRSADGWTIATVRDDGRGFDLPATRSASRRLGLTSMRDRVEALGGRLRIDTAPQAGTEITAEVPDEC
jgi:signal transduction histidine kinase